MSATTDSAEAGSVDRSTGIDWSTWFLNNPRGMLLMVGLVIVSGLTSLAVLPRMEDPVIGERAGLVVTRLPGADAERVEVLVTEPIEDRIQEIEEIKKIASESRPGISSIQIELREEVLETDNAWNDVRSKIDDVMSTLPPEASRPVFEEMDVRAYALITAVCWDHDDNPNWGILRRLSKQLEDRLQAIPGTEIVDRFADPGEQIVIELDPTLISELGITIQQVADAMNGADAKSAAGILRSTDNELIIKLSNQFEQTARIADTLVATGPDEESIRLGDLATITRGVPSPLPRLAMVNNRPAVSLGTMVRPGERLDIWRAKAQMVLDQFRRDLPQGISLSIPLDQSRYVDARLGSLLTNLLIGALAVTAVVWFLMGMRSALVVGMSLPLSALTVLFGLRVLGIPIHQMSVTGMIIAMGLLIDNAIVAVDEISVMIKAGKTPTQAVRKMVRHLAIPLLGSTITTALAFAPIAMMPGNAGEFVGSIAISVIIAISASLFFSLTVIPAVAARLLSNAEQDAKPVKKSLLRDGFSSDKLTQRYRRLLRWILEKPMRGVGLGLILPVTGFALSTTLPEQFFPPADRDQFHIQVELPVNSPIDSTVAITNEMTDLVHQAGAEQVSWFFGESAPTFYYNVVRNKRGVSNFANAIVQMPTEEGLPKQLRELQLQADRRFPEARILFRQLEQGPPFDAPVELRLFGPDLDQLTELGDKVRLALASAPNVIHTKSLLNETQPAISYRVSELDAKLSGLTPSQVSGQLLNLLEGQSAGSVLEDTEQIPVLVRVSDDRRRLLQSIDGLPIVTREGSIPVGSVADSELIGQIAVIPHFNRIRMNLISGYVTAGTLPSEALTAFEENLAASGFVMPPGYRLEYGGEASQRDDAVGNLMANVGVLAVAMVAVLVLSFGSFRLAGLVLVVAACSGGLGVIGLWMGGYPFGFMAIIGIMGLIGVAINDTIVVLAALQGNTKARGASLDGLIDTVVGCTRHVVATTLTTIAGFAPLIIDGGEFWPPLAIAVAGGVGGATLMAVIFIPAAYRLIVKPLPQLICQQATQPAGLATA